MKFLLALVFISFGVFAHNTPLRTYHLITPDNKLLKSVADKFEITHKLANGYEVLVPESRLADFMALSPNAILVHSENKMMNFAGYRDLNKVNQELKDLAAKYPELAKLESYGETRDGHSLNVLKVSDNVQMDEDEPELMITAATHGDEIITVEVEMEFITSLLENYEKDPRLTKMVKEHEFFFIPVVNPQGYSRTQRYANDVDPNRDYPYPGKENKKSVDCIEALIKFFHSRQIKGSIDLHAYGKLIMYPWAYTRTPPEAADKANFEYVTHAMAEVNKYEAGQISRIIYVAKGSSADYYYWKNQTFALGIEMTNSKAPPFSSVPKIVEESKEMLYRFVEHF